MKYITTAFIFHKNKLLLVFHKKLNRWMHVGGHLEGEESFSESLLREIKEETNLEVDVIDFDSSGIIVKGEPKKEPIPFFIHTANRNGSRKTMLDYIAVAKNIENLKIQEEELSDYRWVTIEELSELDEKEMIPVLKELAISAFSKYDESK